MGRGACLSGFAGSHAWLPALLAFMWVHMLLLEPTACQPALSAFSNFPPAPGNSPCGQVVVEMLPSIRLLRNSRRCAGYEALRVASLQAWGYSVITVPCAEWQDLLPTSSPGRFRILATLCALCGLKAAHPCASHAHLKLTWP